MKAIILCAGYATRLYPLTLSKPKPLLDIKGIPLLDYIVSKISNEVNEIIVISNNNFYNCFLEWSKKHDKIKVVNDGVDNNGSRLGGIGDLYLAIEREKINDDILVVLGDNLFDFDIKNFIKKFTELKKTLVGIYELDDKEIVKMGQIRISGDNKIVEFTEKANPPISNLSSVGIYIFAKEDLGKIEEYMKTSKPKEGPGYLVRDFLSSGNVYAYKFKGRWFDIGSKETYEEVNKIW